MYVHESLFSAVGNHKDNECISKIEVAQSDTKLRLNQWCVNIMQDCANINFTQSAKH